ncbi:MAG: TerB family tellurite resistance protein [bacterium]
MSNEEENYIHQKEIDKVQAERRERQLQALRDEERAKIASALHTNEEVAAEALELGFDAETAHVLPLVPLIQVAWADDKLTDAEAKKIMDLASVKHANSPAALEFLEMLLAKKPSQVFFERTERVIRHMIQASPDPQDGRDILETAKAVAEASGGFFGLRNPIGPEEQAILDDLAELLGL